MRFDEKLCSSFETALKESTMYFINPPFKKYYFLETKCRLTAEHF